MFLPSVGRAALAVLLFACCLPSIGFAQASLQGKWACEIKKGTSDPNLTFELSCSGTLHFKSNYILESTCTDGFFPSGTYWEMTDRQLFLRDSAGKAFVQYEVLELSRQHLRLQRRGTVFLFNKVK